MATRSFLLVPVTFCLLLVVLPAQSKEDRAVVIFCGTAGCKNNPSRIISNATLHVTINGTTLATGKTTSTGRFLMTANVPSEGQLIALVSKKAVITAPRQACGVLAADATVRKLALAAPADFNGLGILSDSSEGNPDSSEDIQYIVAVVDDGTPEVLGLLNFLEDSGLGIYDFLNMIVDFLGIPPYK